MPLNRICSTSFMVKRPRRRVRTLAGARPDRPGRAAVTGSPRQVSETHGAQEGCAYNGHFGCTCYHPLFVFNQFGDLERCALRPRNVHSIQANSIRASASS